MVRLLVQATNAAPLAASAMTVNPGPLAMADLEGDGDLDLFVGDGSRTGRYPEPGGSCLLRRRGETFELDLPNTEILQRAGVVNGAVFSDVDGDGDPDLVLACEWGPVRLYRNESGTLKDVTAEVRLGEYLGLWNGVTAGDFDGDGRMDLAASNWGRNSRYEWVAHHGLRLFHGDIDGNGVVETIESYRDPASGNWMPLQPFQAVGRALPLLREMVPSFEAYSRLSIPEIYGDAFKSSVDVNWLDSTVFLNRGDRFEPRRLPAEAQFAPAFGLAVGDFNGDGNEDLFLSQNFFAVEPETSRLDAGRGLWLEGNGAGGFTAWSGARSGVRVYGEQRGAAVGDFDNDGRLDLVVAQNGTETKLYRNVSAPEGLRVRLKGPLGNPAGVGAVLRWVGEGGAGPAREVHAGAGYWSQDDAVQILYVPPSGDRIEVAWPGGTRSTTRIVERSGGVSLTFGR